MANSHHTEIVYDNVYDSSIDIEDIKPNINSDTENSNNEHLVDDDESSLTYDEFEERTTNKGYIPFRKEDIDEVYEHNIMYGIPVQKNYVISTYQRKYVFDYLSQHGFSLKSLKEATKSFKVPTRVFADWLEKKIERDTKQVDKCFASDISYQAVEQLLNQKECENVGKEFDIKVAKFMKECAAHYEKLSPAKFGGVNLNAMFKWLAQACTGSPVTVQLNNVTAAFLCSKFEKMKNKAIQNLETAAIAID